MRKTCRFLEVQILFHKQSVLTGEAPPPTTKQPLPACLSVNDAVLCLIVVSEATLTFQSEHVVRGKEAQIKIFDGCADSVSAEGRSVMWNIAVCYFSRLLRWEVWRCLADGRIWTETHRRISKKTTGICVCLLKKNRWYFRFCFLK